MDMVSWGVGAPAVGAAFVKSLVEVAKPFSFGLAVGALWVGGLAILVKRAMRETCNECDEAEQDIAHKIAAANRRKNDALIANLSSMR